MTVELDRRRFVQLALGATGIGVLSGAGTLVAGAAPPGGGGGSGGGTVAGGTNRLFVPPAIGATGTTLTAASTEEQLGAGRVSKVLTYNSSFPAPTFQVRKGDAVSVRLRNELPGETSVHWHGLVVPTAHDGQPHEAVPGGGERLYGFTVRQRAALNFYHPHPHLKTGSQVYLGMAGAFLVRDAEEDALGLPSGAQEIPLVVRDASFDSAGNLTYGGKASGFEGKLPLVNGTLDPYVPTGAGTYRLRIVNAATARIFGFTLSNDGSFLLLGNDGGLLPKAVSLKRLDLCPGERADVLVTLPAANVSLRCARAGWTLVTFRHDPGVAAATHPLAAGASLSVVPALPAPVRTRRFSFDGMTRINGKVFDHASAFSVPSDVVERWSFVTNGNAPHPVHVHGASFQVERRTGGRAKTNGLPNGLYPWEGGWKDTVLLEDGEQVDVLVRFDWAGIQDAARPTAPQRYLLHCHKLEHEDAGMMVAFDVLPPA